jgi:hypothetical protein
LHCNGNAFPSIADGLQILRNRCDYLASDQHDCGIRRVTQGLAAFGDVRHQRHN